MGGDGLEVGLEVSRCGAGATAGGRGEGEAGGAVEMVGVSWKWT